MLVIALIATGLRATQAQTVAGVWEIHETKNELTRKTGFFGQMIAPSVDGNFVVRGWRFRSVTKELAFC